MKLARFDPASKLVAAKASQLVQIQADVFEEAKGGAVARRSGVDVHLADERGDVDGAVNHVVFIEVNELGEILGDPVARFGELFDGRGLRGQATK